MAPARSELIYLQFLLLIIFSIVVCPSSVQGQPQVSQSHSLKHPISVSDVIATTRLGDRAYFEGRSPQGGVAQFSPDGKRFIIVLRKGNPQRNTNDFSIYIFTTADIFRSPTLNRLLTMASSSNRDAIHDLRWLDNETLAFIGENPGDNPQVYTLNVRTRHLKQQTHHARPVDDYALSSDGRLIVFVSEAPERRCGSTDGERRLGIVVTGQRLSDLIKNICPGSEHERQLFVQRSGKRVVQIPVTDSISIYPSNPIALSPNDRYALITAWITDMPEDWADYRDERLRRIVTTPRRKGEHTTWQRYLLLDTKNNSIVSLLNAPMPIPSPVVWGKDGQSIFLRCYLPLDVTDQREREARMKEPFPVEVSLPGLELRKITDDEWRKLNQLEQHEELAVTLEEDANTPPKVYVSNPRTSQKALLLDLNPQFTELHFGKVERITWVVHGIELEGGLYLPPDYSTGKRYPLVIQTHGFSRDRFSMDGFYEWSSAYAARPLAAHGFLVLQTYQFTDRKDRDRVASDRSLGATEAQSFKTFSALAYEKAVDYLDSREMIDRDRVGISAFSRAVCYTAYALTHTKSKFAAGILTDGIDCGYFQYTAVPNIAWDANALDGGVAPYGDGLKEWLKEAPGFNLDKVRTPMRLVALNPESVLNSWEWYVGLTLQRKAVDLIEIPDASHLMQRPRDRQIAMQGVVDWFRFWLQGAEDRDTAKAEQYDRWKGLREKYLVVSSSATNEVIEKK